MKKTKKNGFTIVELVIVIAVIAILIAVLIPTFSKIIGKANESNDTQIVRQLNTAIEIESVADESKRPATMYDAIEVTKDYGFDAAKIVAKSKLSIAWDSLNKRFVLLDEDKDTYVFPVDASNSEAGPILETERVNYFLVRKNFAENTKGYSVYAGPDWNETSQDVSVSFGFDVGNVEGITSVTYNGGSSAQDVVIRTNSVLTDLALNAPNDDIYFYGKAGKILGTEGNAGAIVAPNSLHIAETAEVTYIKIEQGHIENKGTIDIIFATTDAVKVTNTGDIDHAHVHVGTASEDKEKADTLNANSFGITFDYDENVEQNADPEVYHHVTTEEANGEGAATGHGKVVGEKGVTRDETTNEVIKTEKDSGAFEPETAANAIIVKKVAEEDGENINKLISREQLVYPTQVIEELVRLGMDDAAISDLLRKPNLVWNARHNLFGFADGEVIDYGAFNIETGFSQDTWVFSDNYTSQHPCYLFGENTISEIAATNSLDVGKNIVSTVKYTGGSEAKAVVIRTNGGKLNIDAKNDTVNHYATSEQLTFTGTTGGAYHECGAVAQLTLVQGHVVIEPEGFVNQVTVEESEGKSLENKGILGQTAPAGLTVTGNGVVGLDGLTTISVGTPEKLQGLAYACNMGHDFKNQTIELTNDIDLSGRVWTPFGFLANNKIQKPDTESDFERTYAFKGTIDGKGFTITGLSNNGYKETFLDLTFASDFAVPFGLIIAAAGDVKISNLTIEANIESNGEKGRVAAFVAAFIDTLEDGSIEFENCIAKGSVSAKQKVAGFLGTGYVCGDVKYHMETNVLFKNCKNQAEITGNRSAGFIGTASVYSHHSRDLVPEGTTMPKYGGGSIRFIDCKNEADVIDNNDNKYANGGFIGYLGYGSNVYFKNCTSFDLTPRSDDKKPSQLIGYLDAHTKGEHPSKVYIENIDQELNIPTGGILGSAALGR